MKLPAFLKNKWTQRGLVGAGVVGLGVLAVVLWPQTPPAVDAPVEQVLKFAATEQFVALPADQKQAYAQRFEQMNWDQRREAMEQANLPRDQRGQAMRNLMQQNMQARMDGYFALQTEKERTAYLDKMIDEWEVGRAERERQRAQRQREREAAGQTSGAAQSNGNGQSANGQGGDRRRGDGQSDQGGERRRGWSDPSRQKARLEEHSPEERAKRAAFFAALSERREQRGLPPMGGPGGGGPGGGRRGG
jgi:hypothetical protein